MGFIAVKEDTGKWSNENRLLPLGRCELTRHHEWLSEQVGQIDNTTQQQSLSE